MENDFPFLMERHGSLPLAYSQLHPVARLGNKSDRKHISEVWGSSVFCPTCPLWSFLSRSAHRSTVTQPLYAQLDLMFSLILVSETKNKPKLRINWWFLCLCNSSVWVFIRWWSVLFLDPLQAIITCSRNVTRLPWRQPPQQRLQRKSPVCSGSGDEHSLAPAVYQLPLQLAAIQLWQANK